MRAIFREAGYTLGLETPTNQVFVVLENSALDRLAEKVEFSFFETYDETHTVIRLATNWATRMEDVEKLGPVLADLR